MDIRKLQRAIVDGLEDVKAQDILVFNTEHLSPLFERVIIASGTSNRQTKALASSVRQAVREAGFPVLATEGGDNGEWIIVDCGAAVAHIMQPAIREYYRLEEIWGGKPVKMKIGSDAPKGLVKASEEDEDEPAPQRKARTGTKITQPAQPARAAKPAAKPAAKKAAAKSPTQAARPAAAGKRAPARKAAAPQGALHQAALKPAAGRAPAKKAAAAKRAPARKTAAPAAPVQMVVVKPSVRSSAAAKARQAAKDAAPGRKTASAGRKAAAPARQAPARQAAAPARKAPARKTPGRKTPSRG